MSDEIFTQESKEGERRWNEKYEIKHFVTYMGQRCYGTFTVQPGQNTEFYETRSVTQEEFEDEDLWMTN